MSSNLVKNSKYDQFKVCRNRKTVKLWELPEEVTLMLFRGLHVCDLLNLRSTSSYFRDLIDANPTVWSHVSFSSSWPSIPNLRHFEKAANLGNIEALVKLGIAYLYNEGLPGDIMGKEITGNGERAAQLFCQLETLCRHHNSFTWIFIRPPWASCGACCKEFVFSVMKRQANMSGTPGIHVCVAKTLQLLEEEDWESDISYHLTQAAHGSVQAALMLWQKHCKYNINSWAGELSVLRELRYLVSRSQDSPNRMEACLELCHMYAQQRFGGIAPSKAWAFVRNFLQSSKPVHIEKAFRPGLTQSMRFILIDWLVEVAGMKDFSSLTLHTAINIVDRYLMLQPTTRSQLQLLGVAAMVISSRFLGRDIITVREAAWLTDNTYKYGDVVKMLGEITAALRGNFRVITTFDYIILLGELLSNDPKTQSLCEYICELSLLHVSLGSLPQAEVAAAACLLARMHTSKDCIWPSSMANMSGFSQQNLSKAVLEVHKKCFIDFGLQDYRHVELQAVKQRYDDERFHSVSAIEILPRSEVLSLLGLKEEIVKVLPTFPKSSLLLPPMETQDIILSPSRHGHRSAAGLCRLSAERENAATPTLEAMEASFDLNESVISEVSGYEGDMDEDEESFSTWNDTEIQEISGLESLWSDDDDDVEVLPDEWRSALDLSPEASSSSWIYSDNSVGVSSPVGLSVIPSLRVTFSPSDNSSAPSTSDESIHGQSGDSSLHHSFNIQGRCSSSGLNLSTHTPEIGHTMRSFQDGTNMQSIPQSALPFNDEIHDSFSTTSFSVSKEGSSCQTTKPDLPGLRMVNPNIPNAPQVKRKSPSQDGNVSKKYVFSLP